MNKILKIILFANLVILLLAAIGCSEDSGITNTNTNNQGSITTNITGAVVNEAGEPLSGATVTIYGQTKTTGSAGEFMFTNISVPSTRFFITAEKTGYFKAVKGEISGEGNVSIKLTMIQKTVTHTVNSQAGGSADLTNGSKIEFQPGAFVKSDGSAYTGTVNLSVKYMDPTDSKFSETVAGGDMLARRSDSTDVVLYSYGMLKIEMESPSGEELNITSGKPSTITTTIPASMVSSAPQTIPLWYFDESSGLWREEGTATKQGDKYIGTVTHFTDWNNDYAGYITRVEGRIVDCQGNPIPGLVVKVGQTTTLTDEAGNYVRTVPTGVDFDITVEASQNFGISGDPIHIPALTNNQVYQVPLCQLACYPVISGSFKNCSGSNIYGMLSVSWDNRLQGIMPTQVNGFRVYTAPNKQAHLKFTAYTGEVIDTVVTTPSNAVELALGELRSCAGITCETSFYLNGAGYNNVFVSLPNVLSLSVYSIPDSLTAITAASTDSVTLSLAFTGNTQGYYPLSTGVIGYHGSYFTGAETVNITVTHYGTVGDNVKGTFEGTLISGTGTINVNNGKFCALRQPDVQ